MANSSSGSVARFMYSQNFSSLNELNVSLAEREKILSSLGKTFHTQMKKKTNYRSGFSLSTATKPLNSQTAIGRSSVSAYELFTPEPVNMITEDS